MMKYFLFIIGVSLFIFDFSMYNTFHREWTQGFQEYQWKKKKAKVTNIDIKESKMGNMYCYLLIYYSYSVEKKLYIGKDISRYHKLLKRNAKRVIEENYKNTISIYYNPQRPFQSKIYRYSYWLAWGVFLGYLLIIIMGLVSTLVGIIMFYKKY